MKREDFGGGGAFVMGGSGGLGRAICAAFARAGVPVALSYHSDREAAEQCADTVRLHGVAAHVFQLDANNRKAIVRTLEDAAVALEGLHSVVYAAGPFVPLDLFCNTDDSVWQDWLGNDVLGAINLAYAAIPHLRRSRGAYTSLSTYQGEKVEVRGGPSAIAKAAVDKMVKVVAKEEGPHGVRANSVRCGTYECELVERMFALRPGRREEKKLTIPLGRIGRPEELGETIVFLSSRRAGFITGANLIADGGESL